MLKLKLPTCLALLAVVCSWVAVGCSSDPQLPPAASKEKILEGDVSRAKPLLSILEKTKPELRQAAASSPRMAATLQAASADPATKKKLDDLGVHVN